MQNYAKSYAKSCTLAIHSSQLFLADTASYQGLLLPRRRPTSPSHLATKVRCSILAAKVPPPQASSRFAGPRRPSSLLSPCHVQRAHAHSCQRADNVLFWPAVTLPSFSLRRPPRRHVAAKVSRPPRRRAPHRRQGQPPSPSPPLPVAAKVSSPSRRRRSSSQPRSAALPVTAAPRRRQGPP